MASKRSLRVFVKEGYVASVSHTELKWKLPNSLLYIEVLAYKGSKNRDK